MGVRLAAMFFLGLGLTATQALVFGGDGPISTDEASKGFDAVAAPIIKRYCLECHSTEEQEGDLDLERFTNLDQARNAPRVWQRVAEVIKGGEMPPKESRQPGEDERDRLRRWVGDFLSTEATRRAGDPGRVVLRRLNNAEYTYTLRDLTGVASLEPAREFPVDGAAGEGFTNTGNALVMSPSLVTKYLDAAKGVAAHAVLLPDGFRFSSATTARDWTEETLAEIREFYREFTDPKGGGDSVNLQGIVFNTNQGGRLPLERYLAATVIERDALTSGAKSFETVARERGLNARYLGTLWRSLTTAEPSLLLAGLQARWRAAKAEDVPDLVAEVSARQKGLWKFSGVGHIGKVGGPKAWMEPVNPLVARREIRFKIPPSTDGKAVPLSLVATDAGDGNAHDFVVWRDPRIVAPGRPDLPLRDFADVKGIGTDIRVQAPAVVSFHLPAELAGNAELVTSGTLDDESGELGSVQLEVVAGSPRVEAGLSASAIVVKDGGEARKRIEAALDDFRNLFPPALCYSKIVPVDEVITLTLFHREDGHLARLMLDEAQKSRLDRLWDELHFISGDALTLVDALAQLMEYASQDGDPKVLEPLRKPINDRADEFRRRLVEAEPRQLDALLRFAAQAYRRPLTASESSQLRKLYDKLRSEEMPRDEAFRLTLARVLVAPAFLYRAEQPVPGPDQGPVSVGELATRLSYFLWSSQPDPELRGLADSGRLTDPDVLARQARRMLRDDKARRLATEFACQWLGIADFDQLDEKSERHFPTFLGLRGAMHEESVRFFTDLFQNDGSILGILGADHTFLNGPLAKHYGIPWEQGPPEDWQRVDGIKQFGRGGILGQATTLAKQSGASRTSPTLRGNWISEVLLGERLPRPPKGVPQLPDDEAATDGLTVRQLVEQHAGNPKCAGCHQRIDPLGFSLEAFDAIGRRRDKDLGDRPIDTRAKALDGAEFDGLEGLKDYLLTARLETFLDQFCRKLLGFALGRSTQLSDDMLLTDMKTALKANDYRFGSAVEAIVRSRQFREIRGRDAAYTD